MKTICFDVEDDEGEWAFSLASEHFDNVRFENDKQTTEESDKESQEQPNDVYKKGPIHPKHEMLGNTYQQN